MNEQCKSTHGGKRDGAGRKSKYNCKTTTMRVPEHLKEAIEQFIRNKIDKEESIVSDHAE